jgi:hypothetical protein
MVALNVEYTMSTENTEDAVAYAKGICSGFEKKADKKKNSSKLLFTIILTSSLSAPLFIAYGGTCKLTAQIIPSVLSVLAAGLSSWVQIRNPQKLWSVYRSAQRLIEDEMTKYRFRVDDYQTSSDPNQLLAKRVAEVALHAHDEWTAIVPNPNFSSTPPTIPK